MLTRLSKLTGTRIYGIDGVVGSVTDVFIDEIEWAVRYLLVSLSCGRDDNSSAARQVLLSPVSLEAFDPERSLIATNLDRHKIISSPVANFEEPISRQYESALVDYYGWPIYWLGRTGRECSQIVSGKPGTSNTSPSQIPSESNLRSGSEIRGFQINSFAGRAGFLKDLVLNSKSWEIEAITGDPSYWLPRENSMVSASCISEVDWDERIITVELLQDGVRSSSVSTSNRQYVIDRPWAKNPQQQPC